MARLLEDPRVRELVASRRRRYVGLSGVVSALYLAVALGCAFAPELMRRPVGGTGISLGIASMAAIIIVGIACSGYYTWWSNTVRDPQVEAILQARRAGATAAAAPHAERKRA